MFFIYQKRGFEAKAILSSNTKKDIIYTEKWKALQNPAYRAMNQTPHTPVDKNLNALEFSYEIRPGISAVLRSSYMDTENKGENPRLMMAGVNLGKNKFISTQFYAGDANGGISYLYSGILAYDSMLMDKQTPILLIRRNVFLNGKPVFMRANTWGFKPAFTM